jgi:hypothetical protein
MVTMFHIIRMSNRTSGAARPAMNTALPFFAQNKSRRRALGRRISVPALQAVS